MSVMSNIVLMNGSCHGQQLSPLVANVNAISPSGDNPSSEGLHKPALQSTLDHNEEHHSDNKSNGIVATEGGGAEEEEAPCIDITINNVVCSFSTKCYVNLRKVAMEGLHVEFRRENGMLNMKLRRPNVTATIWSSGNVTCTGSTSEDEAKLSARRIARCLQRIGFNARFTNYRVVNVLGTCSVNFGIKLGAFSMAHRQTSSYEPELHPGVTYRIKDPKATLKIFSTGSITVTAPCVSNVQHAIEHIYPLVLPFKMDKPHLGRKDIQAERKALKRQGVYLHPTYLNTDEDDEEEEDEGEDEEEELEGGGHLGAVEEDDFSDDFDSDVSQD